MNGWMDGSTRVSLCRGIFPLYSSGTVEEVGGGQRREREFVLASLMVQLRKW